jgi:hypothetical protein
MNDSIKYLSSLFRGLFKKSLRTALLSILFGILLSSSKIILNDCNYNIYVKNANGIDIPDANVVLTNLADGEKSVCEYDSLKKYYCSKISSSATYKVEVSRSGYDEQCGKIFDAACGGQKYFYLGVEGSLYLAFDDMRLPFTPYYNLVGIFPVYKSNDQIIRLQRYLDSLGLITYKSYNGGMILESNADFLKAKYPKLLKSLALNKLISQSGPIYKMDEGTFSIITNCFSVQFEKSMTLADITAFFKKYGISKFTGPDANNTCSVCFQNNIGYGICAKTDEMIKSGKVRSLTISTASTVKND